MVATMAQESTRVPKPVIVTLGWALGELEAVAASLRQARETDRMFQGRGRYEYACWVEIRAAERIARADERIRQFLTVAGNHGIDGGRVVAEQGGMPPMGDLTLSAQAREWER